MAGTAWDVFERRMHELSDIGSALGLLGWDQQTMTPPKGHGPRGQVVSTLSAIYHERLVDPAYGEAIDALAADGAGLDEVQRTSVRLARHDRDRAVRVPTDLVRALAEQTSRTHQAWEAARHARDYAIYEPELEKVVALTLEKADALGHDGERYDALLEDYEPGMRVERLEPLLGGLREALVPFVGRLLERPAPEDGFLHVGYPDADQWTFSLELLHALGFDFEAGRQDRSTHPFTGGGGPLDVRLTTRIFPDFFPSCVFSTIHEAGHGLYEQGMPEAFHRTPVGQAPSLGAHESQSRFWENVVGRSAPFWEWALPRAQELFPTQLAGVDPTRMAAAVCKVQRSPIRVEADEATYNLHILVRFELELALLREELAVADLPAAWRERYVQIVGYEPKDDGEGVMQDIHWSGGAIGYFPTYTLGNLYAASLAERLAEDLDLAAHVRAGDFAPILGWMRTHVHAKGHLQTAEELMQGITGRPLDHDPFMRYLEGKYGELYGL